MIVSTYLPKRAIQAIRDLAEQRGLTIPKLLVQCTLECIELSRGGEAREALPLEQRLEDIALELDALRRKVRAGA